MDSAGARLAVRAIAARAARAASAGTSARESARVGRATRRARGGTTAAAFTLTHARSHRCDTARFNFWIIRRVLNQSHTTIQYSIAASTMIS